jgi:PAS domain S-box-containing protein
MIHTGLPEQQGTRLENEVDSMKPEHPYKSTPNHFLFIDDSAEDIEFLAEFLKAKLDVTFEYQQVMTPDALDHALRAQSWDIIFCDFFMPLLTAADAIQLIRSIQSQASIILVSGLATVQDAVNMMRVGASAFVEKTDQKRLLEIVHEELETVHLRRKAAALEAALQANSAYYQSIVDGQTELICRYDPDLRLRFVNRAYCEWQGCAPDDLIGTSFIEKIPVEDRERALAHVQALTVDNPVAVSIHASIIADGSVQIQEWTDRAIFDANGELIEYQGVGRDVTQRESQAKRLAEVNEELAQFRIHMDAVLDTMQDALMSVSLPDHETIFVSRAFEEIFGYPYERFKNDPHFFQQIVHPDDLERTIAAQQKCLTDGTADLDHRIILPDGTVRWIHRRSWTNYDESGNPIRINDIARDITEQKNNQRLIAEREINLQTLFDTIDDFLFILDENGLIIEVNQTVPKRLGYSPEELIGQSVLFVHPEDRRTEAQQIIGNMLQGSRRSCPIPLQMKDGGQIPVETFVTKGKWNGQPALFGLSKDISELKLSEEKFSVAFQANSTIAGLSSIETGEYVEVNDAFCEKLGFTREEVIGVKASTLLQLDPVWRAKTMQKLQAQGYVREEETVILAKDGTPVPVLLSAGVIMLQGKPYNFTTAVDITDLKQAEASLRESEEKYRSLIDSSTSPIVMMDYEGRYSFANKIAVQPFGGNLEALVGKTAHELFPADEADVILQDARSVIESGIGLITEHKLTVAGDVRWFSSSMQPVYDVSGTVSAVLVNSTDVTPLKQSQAKLKAMNEQLEQRVAERTAELEYARDRIEAIFNHSADGILLLDHELKIQQSNYAFDQMLMGEPDGAIGHSLFDWIASGDRMILEPQFADLLFRHEIRRLEVKLRRNDGTYFHAEISIAPIDSDEQVAKNLVCIIRDISERKQVEAEHRRYIAEIEDLYNNAPSGYHSLDKNGVFVQINDTELGWLGYSREELVGKRRFSDFLTPESQQSFREKFMTLQERGEITGVEFELISKNGAIVYILGSATVIRDENGEYLRSRSTLYNITQLKQAQKVIAEERNLLRTVIDAVPNFIYVKNDQHQVILNNVAHAQFVGNLIRNPLEGDDYFTRMEPELEQKIRTTEKHILESGQPLADIEDLIERDGIKRWTTTTKVPLRNLENNVVGLVGITSDITHLKQQEALLRESEEKFRTFIESAPITTIISNMRGEIVLVNKAAEHLFGYSRDQLIGESIQILVPDELRDHHQVNMTNFVASDRQWVNKIEVTARQQSGHVFPVDIQLNRVQIGDESLVMALVIDITQKKLAEEALHEALKKEKDVGALKSQFVSTASHQFRTPLATILSAAETLSIYRDRLDPSQIDDRLNRIRNQVNRMKRLMDDVLELARIQANQVPYKPEQIDLNSLCHEMIDEFVTQQEYQNRIVYVAPIKPLISELDPHLMHHIITNLVHNALKYSPAEKQVHVHLSLVDEIITFKVMDQGIGIPPDELDKLFIPFNRASNARSIDGTGLGLSIVKQAVDVHEGTIHVESTLGLGTTFVVKLPYRGAV